MILFINIALHFNQIKSILIIISWWKPRLLGLMAGGP